MPQISVVVPIYNAEKFLPRCIDSILNQTFQDIEIWLVNDGSVDHSAQICDEYALKDSRVHVLHGENKGVTAARKEGVLHSKGRFVCFVDADDYILPYYLKDLYDALADDADIAYAASADGHTDSINYIRMLLRNTCDWGLPYKLYRRSLFTADVFDIPREINVGEDLIASIKIAFNIRKIVSVQCDGYVYYQNQDSVTHQRKFSLEYEEAFMKEVDKTLHHRMLDFEEDVWVFKMRTWKNLVKHRIYVNRKKEWVQWILNNRLGMSMAFGDKLMIYLPFDSLVSFLLRVLDVVKAIGLRP